MNKVIVVHTYVNNFDGAFGEFNFPQIDTALNEGWFVKEILSVVLPANGTNNCYALVFSLQK